MFREHRRRFLDLLRERTAAAVIPTASAKVRNHDSQYRYRPDSDFWYLTGFAEPESALVLLPSARGVNGDAHRPQSVLFLREKDREKEIWNGRRLGVAAAPDTLGIDEARPIERLWRDLPELLKGYERIVYRAGADETRDRRMMKVYGELRARAKGSVRPPLELLDPAPFVHELRLRKSAAEIEIMRRGAEISRVAHTEAMRRARPGVRENELDALLEYTFRRLGGTGAAYTNIVAGGANATILHYVENDQPLADGDLVLIDAGAECEFYASDVTRTFPVNGTFSDVQRSVYELVLEAQLAAIDAVQPGASFTAPHDRALEVLCTGLLRLGLLKGTLKDTLHSESYRRFYMHRTSHWLGLDVHDCGAYVDGGNSRALEPGMVLTVEPGIYIAPDDETVDARYRGIGIRIEDDVLVTASGRDVITAGIPKTVAEVEATCQGRTLAPSA